jgi:hypothetical protein
MAQLTIYLPDNVLVRLRREAKRAGTSLSAYVTQLATRSQRKSGWPRSFASLFGACRGELPDVEDAPAEEVDSL